MTIKLFPAIKVIHPVPCPLPIYKGQPTNNGLAGAARSPKQLESNYPDSDCHFLFPIALLQMEFEYSL